MSDFVPAIPDQFEPDVAEAATVAASAEEERKERARQSSRKWYSKNKELHRSRCDAWLLRNRERKKETDRANYLANREDRLRKGKLWREANKEKHRKAIRAWREANREREYARHKARMEDPIRKFALAARNRINVSLRRGSQKKSAASQFLVGCSWGFLRCYLEKQFTRGMSWDNYGKVWHIDHIIPCAKFDLSKPEEQRACFHYSNLRPLCAKKNISEGDRKGVPQQSTMFHLLDNPNDL